MGLMRLVRLRDKDVWLSWFAIKASITGGIVYLTIHEGLWSKSEESVKFYEKVYNNVAPYVKDNLPNEVVHEFNRLPSTGAISDCTKTSWNNGVMASMKFMSELPSHVSNGINSLSSSAQKYLLEGNELEKK